MIVSECVLCAHAVQVEEAYRSAESLCKSMAIDVSPVLRFEVLLLQGLKFDLVVHSPYRALAGLFKVGGVIVLCSNSSKLLAWQ